MKIIKYLIMCIFALLTYYFMLPSINFTDPELYIYLVINIIGIIIINIIFAKENLVEIIIDNKVAKKSNKGFKIICTLGIIFAIIVIINLFNSPLFRSKSYAKRINVETGEFKKDVKPVDFSKLALIDKESSIKLGDKVMGQMTDLVSQFEVSNLYTQINYKDEILRVTPLEYDGIIKYITNRKKGIPGFITVNSVTGDSKLVRLEKGMKYVPSGLFFENLYRKLRFSYPLDIFGEINFEIDDNGNPYWIVEILKYHGIGLRREVKGIIMFNPIEGRSKKYNVKDVPNWVDHVYSSNLVMEELLDWGIYKNGFINSRISQKNVVKPTTGYNYMAMNNDIYMYTGITSVSNDESNVGFILTNLRTKETKFYDEPGTIETSVMESAKGQVQQMKYTATFPLLINLDNKPTYVLSLKDNAGLIKMYAFVDYTDYQKVVVTDQAEGIIKAAQNYLGKNISQGNELQKEIIIEEITSGIIDGNTYYYIKSNGEIYKMLLKEDEINLPFLKQNDKINIFYKESKINEILKIVK